MEKLYPSEIARLVLGYLKEVKCPNSWQKFLVECTDLQEYYRLYKDGGEYSTKVYGKSLIEILDEYWILKSGAVQNSASKINNNQVNPDSSNTESFKTPSKSNRTAALKHRSAQKIQTQSVTATLRYKQLEESLEKTSAPSFSTPTTPRIRTPRRLAGFTVKSLNFSGESCSSNNNAGNIAGRVCYSDPISKKSHRCIQTDISYDDLNRSSNLHENNCHSNSSTSYQFLQKSVNAENDVKQTRFNSNIQNSDLNSLTVQDTSETLLQSNNQEPVFHQSENEAFDAQSLTVNKSVVCRTSELTTANSNFVVTTLETSYTPQYENEAPPYNRAPSTNSPRLILSMDRSQISSFTTPMKDRKTLIEDFSSPKRKSFIPRRRLLTDSPISKQTHLNDHLALPISNEDWASLEELITFPPLAQKIAENINKVINTDEPLNVSDGPCSSNCLPVQEVVKNVCARTEIDPVFDEFILKMLGNKDVFDGNALIDSSNCFNERNSISDNNVECLFSQQTNVDDKDCVNSSNRIGMKTGSILDQPPEIKSTNENSVISTNTSVSDKTNNIHVNDYSGNEIHFVDTVDQSSDVCENLKEKTPEKTSSRNASNSVAVDKGDSSLCNSQPNYELPSDNCDASQLVNNISSTVTTNLEESDALNSLIECDEIQIIKEIPPSPMKTGTSNQAVQFITSTPNTNQNISTGNYIITGVDNNGIALISPCQNNNVYQNVNSSLEAPVFQMLNGQVPTFIVPSNVPTEMPNAGCQYKMIIIPSANWNSNNLTSNVLLSQTVTPGKSMPNISVGNSLPLQTVTATQFVPNLSINNCLPLQLSTPEKSIACTSSINATTNLSSLSSTNVSPTNEAAIKYTAVESGPTEICVTTSPNKKTKVLKRTKRNKPVPVSNKETRQSSYKRTRKNAKNKKVLKEVNDKIDEVPIISIPDPSPGKSNSLSAMELLSNITSNTEVQSPILKELVSNAMKLAGKGGRLNSTHVRTLDFDSHNLSNNKGNAALKSGNSTSENRRSSTRLQLKSNLNQGLTVPDLINKVQEIEDNIHKTPNKISRKRVCKNNTPLKDSNDREINDSISKLEKAETISDVQSMPSMKDAVLNAMTHVLETNKVDDAKIVTSENGEQVVSNWNSLYISQKEVEEIDLTDDPKSKDQSVDISISINETTIQNNLNENDMNVDTCSEAKFFPSSDSESDSDNLPLSSLIINKPVDITSNNQNNSKTDFVNKNSEENLNSPQFADSPKISEDKIENISKSFLENDVVLSDDTCELPPLPFDLPVILKSQDSENCSNKISFMKEKETDKYAASSKMKELIIENNPSSPISTPKQISKKGKNKKNRKKSNEPSKISNSEIICDNSCSPRYNSKKVNNKNSVGLSEHSEANENFNDVALNKDPVKNSDTLIPNKQISQDISKQSQFEKSPEKTQNVLNHDSNSWFLIPLDLEKDKCNKLCDRRDNTNPNLEINDLRETNDNLNLREVVTSALQSDSIINMISNAPSSNVLHKTHQLNKNMNEPLKKGKTQEESNSNQDTETDSSFLNTNHSTQQMKEIEPNTVKAAKTDRVTKIVNRLLYNATSPAKSLNLISTNSVELKIDTSNFYPKNSINSQNKNSGETAKSCRSQDKILAPPKKRIRPVPIPSPRDPCFSTFTTFYSGERDASLDFDSERNKLTNVEFKCKATEPVVADTQIRRKPLSGKPKAMTEFYKKVQPFRESSIPISPGTISSSSNTLETCLIKKNPSESFLIVNNSCEDTEVTKDIDLESSEIEDPGKMFSTSIENNNSVDASNDQSQTKSSIFQTIALNNNSSLTSNNDLVFPSDGNIDESNTDSINFVNIDSCNKSSQDKKQVKRKFNESNSSEFECSLSNISEPKMNENEELINNDLSFQVHSPLKKKHKVNETSNNFNSSPSENPNHCLEKTKVLNSAPSIIKIDNQTIVRDSPVRSFSPSKNTSSKSVLSQRTEQNPKIPSGVKIPSKWNTSKISSYSTSIENCNLTSKISKEKSNTSCKNSPSKKWNLRIAPSKSSKKSKHLINKKRSHPDSNDRISKTKSPKKIRTDYHSRSYSRDHSKSKEWKSLNRRTSPFRSVHSYKYQDKKPHKNSDYRHSSRSKNSVDKSLKKRPLSKKSNNASPSSAHCDEKNSTLAKSKIPDGYVYKPSETAFVEKSLKTYGKHQKERLSREVSQNERLSREVSHTFVTIGTFDVSKSQFPGNKTSSLEEGEILDNFSIDNGNNKINETLLKQNKKSQPNQSEQNSELAQVNSETRSQEEEEELLRAVAYLTNNNLSSKSCDKIQNNETQSVVNDQSITSKPLSYQFHGQLLNSSENGKKVEESKERRKSENESTSEQKGLTSHSSDSVASTHDTCSVIEQTKSTTHELPKDMKTFSDTPSNSTSVTSPTQEKKVLSDKEKEVKELMEKINRLGVENILNMLSRKN